MLLNAECGTRNAELRIRNGRSRVFVPRSAFRAPRSRKGVVLKLDSSGSVAQRLLMAIPNMTEDIANSILDWIDPDEDTRSNGAENDYYSTLSSPYRCKNGPLDTLEELLLVKGVTPQLLFG